MLKNYAIAIATGLTHEKALLYAAAMSKGKTDVNHLRVK